ncbi:SIZ1 [Candida oxycetoniae]|uniref:SIZ1 n=1 Tax=Candida oxycetoniae TaxID=497107 RepID=A0AAI9SX19_9ASCO|nr:SIZ1 [Candida oxycetoniae]KAI3404692.2 SIZ1 [Candida oxycetoniae]
MSNVPELSVEEYNDTVNNLREMRVAQLKDISRSVGLLVGGTKSVLQKRLEDFFEGSQIDGDRVKSQAFRALVLQRKVGLALSSFKDLYRVIDNGEYSGVRPNDRMDMHRNDSKRYEGHSLIFTENPLFELKRLIHSMPQICRESKKTSSCEFSFVLTREEWAQLRSSGPRTRLYLMCGKQGKENASSTNNVQIQYPSQVEVYLNDAKITQSFRGTSKVGTASPIDLTDSILPPPKLNTIHLAYEAIDANFLVYLYIAETIPLKKIKNRILSKPKISKRHTIAELQKVEDSDGIIMSDYQVSLKDPWGCMRIRYATKSVYCDHLQCFDATFFLAKQLQSPLWECPYCVKPVKIDDLAGCEFFDEILQSTSEDTEHVLISKDAKWQPVVERSEIAIKRKKLSNKDNNKDNNNNNNNSNNNSNNKITETKSPIEMVILSSDSEEENDNESANNAISRAQVEEKQTTLPKGSNSTFQQPPQNRESLFNFRSNEASSISPVTTLLQQHSQNRTHNQLESESVRLSANVRRNEMGNSNVMQPAQSSPHSRISLQLRNPQSTLVFLQTPAQSIQSSTSLSSFPVQSQQQQQQQQQLRTPEQRFQGLATNGRQISPVQYPSVHHRSSTTGSMLYQPHQLNQHYQYVTEQPQIGHQIQSNKIRHSQMDQTHQSHSNNGSQQQSQPPFTESILGSGWPHLPRAISNVAQESSDLPPIVPAPQSQESVQRPVPQDMDMVFSALTETHVPKEVITTAVPTSSENRAVERQCDSVLRHTSLPDVSRSQELPSNSKVTNQRGYPSSFDQTTSNNFSSRPSVLVCNDRVTTRGDANVCSSISSFPMSNDDEPSGPDKQQQYSDVTESNQSNTRTLSLEMQSESRGIDGSVRVANAGELMPKQNNNISNYNPVQEQELQESFLNKNRRLNERYSGLFITNRKSRRPAVKAKIIVSDVAALIPKESGNEVIETSQEKEQTRINQTAGYQDNNGQPNANRLSTSTAPNDDQNRNVALDYSNDILSTRSSVTDNKSREQTLTQEVDKSDSKAPQLPQPAQLTDEQLYNLFNSPDSLFYGDVPFFKRIKKPASRRQRERPNTTTTFVNAHETPPNKKPKVYGGSQNLGSEKPKQVDDYPFSKDLPQVKAQGLNLEAEWISEMEDAENARKQLLRSADSLSGTSKDPIIID